MFGWKSESVLAGTMVSIVLLGFEMLLAKAVILRSFAISPFKKMRQALITTVGNNESN